MSLPSPSAAALDVSIVVPAWNAAAFLPACLDSLLAQTGLTMEIIVVDDGSDDETPALLAGYAAKYRAIRVLTQSNHGVSVARNAGLAVARGEFVAFVDADDTVTATMYATMIAAARANALDVTVCNAVAHGVRDGQRPVFPAMPMETLPGPDWLVAAAARDALRHYIWCHLYRREFLSRQGLCFVPGITHQDIVWTNEVLLAAARVRFVDRLLYHYRQRAGSLSKPESSAMRLAAARHYLRVAGMLDRLARRNTAGPAVRAVLRRQTVEEGIAVFHLARRLVPAHRELLYADLRRAGFMALLWRNAESLRHRRRVLKRGLRFCLASLYARVGQWFAPREVVVGEVSGEPGGE